MKHYNYLSLQLILGILPVLLLTACSSRVSPSLRDSESAQFDIDGSEEPSSLLDPGVQNQSEALHHFLVGQMAYQREDFTVAREQFTEAGKLFDEPVPYLHTRLAELHVRSGDMKDALAESEKALTAEPDDKKALLLHAGILEALNRDSEAEPIYLDLIRKYPDLQEAYMLLAGLYEKRKDYDKSIELLKTLVERNPSDFISHYYLGRAYEGKGDLAAAEKEYRLAMESDSQKVNIAADLIRVLVKRKDFVAVKALCEKMLEQDPSNLLARRVLGQLLLGESKLDEAMEHLKVLESSEADASGTRYKIALIQLQKQNFPEAIRELNLVLAQDPDHEEARYQLASAYASTGQVHDAVEELKKIRPDQKLYAKAWTFAAFLLRQDGDLSEAEKVARKVVESGQSDKQTISFLVQILRDAGKIKDARNLLEDALQKDPRDETLLFSYAVVLNDLKMEKEAMEVMEKVITINPQHSDALNFLAYGLADSGQQLDRAQELVNRALVLKPADGYYLDTLGWIYYKQGKFKEAEETLGRASRAAKDDPEILEHYGDVLLKMHKNSRAKEAYLSALEQLKNSKDSKVRESQKRLEKKLKVLSGESNREQPAE